MTRTGTSPQTAPGLPGRPGLRRSRRAATWCGPYPGSHIWRGMTAQSRQMIKYQNRRELSRRHGGSRFDWSDHSHRRQRVPANTCGGTSQPEQCSREFCQKNYLSRRQLARKNAQPLGAGWARVAGSKLYARRQSAGRGFMPTKTASRHRGDVELLHVHALSNCKKNPWAHRGLSCWTTPPTRQ
jgi:hypothetical protein